MFVYFKFLSDLIPLLPFAKFNPYSGNLLSERFLFMLILFSNSNLKSSSVIFKSKFSSESESESDLFNPSLKISIDWFDDLDEFLDFLDNWSFEMLLFLILLSIDKWCSTELLFWFDLIIWLKITAVWGLVELSVLIERLDFFEFITSSSGSVIEYLLKGFF